MRSGSKNACLTLAIGAACFACATVGLARAQDPQSPSAPPFAADLPGPTFTVPEADLSKRVTVISYGDTRFTDPLNTTATNPVTRRALVKRIAEEKPDAVLLNGDVPWHGGNQADYAVYRDETQPWRDAHLRVFPALGNHEFSQCEVPQCLANWWAAFPELMGRRWYSVRLGKRIYMISLDSDDSLLPGGEQRRWLENQVASLPREIQFVLISMHHPPMADIQARINLDHNPRPNEVALALYLRTAAAAHTTKFVVIAGHIHNYERFLQDGVVYLVSGGGGAKPYEVERTAFDLYQDPQFPNYHYVKFVLEDKTLRGAMYRYSSSGPDMWQAKDTFEVRYK